MTVRSLLLIATLALASCAPGDTPERAQR
ncbi:hypothetical protein LCGC14_2873230, partial [marine sediment metagenome]